MGNPTLPDKRGYRPLWRSFFRHWLWEEKRVFSRAEAWLDLAWNRAAAKPVKRSVRGKTIDLEVGEVCGSQRFFGAAWGWSAPKVARFLHALESDGMITTKSIQGETVVTVSNYEKFSIGADKNVTEALQQRYSDDTAALRGRYKVENVVELENEEKGLQEVPGRLAKAYGVQSVRPNYADLQALHEAHMREAITADDVELVCWFVRAHRGGEFGENAPSIPASAERAVGKFGELLGRAQAARASVQDQRKRQNRSCI